MKRVLITALTTLTIVFSGHPALAQSDLPDAKHVIEVDVDSLVQLIKDAGWKPRPFREDDGTRGVGVTIGTRELVMLPTNCDQWGQCKGLYTYALIPDDPGAADLNNFNLRYNPARATAQNGVLVLDNYIIGDYGIVRGSLAVHLLVQADLISAWWNFRDSKDGSSSFSNSVSFSPISPAPVVPSWAERVSVNVPGIPDTDRFRMLQANGR